MKRNILIKVFESKNDINEKVFVMSLIVNGEVKEENEYDYIDDLLIDLVNYKRSVYDYYKVDCRFDDMKIEMNINIVC